MDNTNGWNTNGNPPQEPLPAKNPHFETASLIIGIVALFSASCGMGIFLGALAVIFGFLSKGGTYTMGPKGKAGVFLGVAAIIFTAITTIIGVVTLLTQFGGIEGFIAEYNRLYDALYSGDVNDAYSILYGMSGVPVQ